LKIRLYRLRKDQDVTALAMANPKETLAVLSDEDIEGKAQSLPARVVTVASEGHRQGTLDFDDLGFEQGYRIMRSYARSKLPWRSP
jgi:hypothetical protein